MSDNPNVAVLREQLKIVQAQAKRAMTQTDYTAVGEKAIRLIPDLLAALEAQASAPDIRYREVLKAVQARGFETVADLIDAFDARQASAPGGEVTDLPAKWRKEADGFMAYTTAPHGRTWDHGAADAKREDARQLEEALAARTGKGA